MTAGEKQQEQTQKSSSWVKNLLVQTIREENDGDKIAILYQDRRWAMISYTWSSGSVGYLPIHCCYKTCIRGDEDALFFRNNRFATGVCNFGIWTCSRCNDPTPSKLVTLYRLME